MLADDSVTAQNMGRKILADAGYEVITVNNGSAALKKIAEARPDLIVLDVYMPGYSGLEVCQRLKDSNETARVPILLTVGKLEPFKPEEARRVRADGFIVKPFEASELLSALTKLEDKIVPRADSSKPGRFARAIAAVEEGRYDKTVAIDEDSGWRSRISFPPKKKEKTVEAEDGDDPAIYNPVNKDLKTTVEHRPPHETQPAPPAFQPPPAQPEPEHLDLGALVAHGLPKDVTAEEIAALAAAAAQVQGIATSRNSESAPGAPATAPEIHQAESPKPVEASPAPVETVNATSAAVKPEAEKAEPVTAPAVSAPAFEAVNTSVEALSKTQLDDSQKIEPKEAALEPAASAETAEVAATFAPEKAEQKEESAPEIKPVEIAREKDEIAKEEEEIVREKVEVASVAAADALPAIASFATADAEPSSDNGTSAHPISTTAEPEPVTMAVAAAHAAVAPPRWTAVAVALAPEETSIALEDEMRKAQALAVSSPEPMPVPVEAPAIEEPAETPARPAVAETLPASTEPAFEPQPAAPSAPESVSDETQAVASMTPVVREFETVTPREPEPLPVVAETPVEPAFSIPPISAETAEVPAVIPIVTERVADAKPIDSIPAPSADSVSSPAANETADSEKEPVVQHEPISEAVTHPAEPEIWAQKEESEAVQQAEISLAQVPETHISQESVEPAAVAATEEISGGLADMAKKESEMAASTAAAWASWRRIRETDSKAPETSEKEADHTASPREEAAMAVAAGAEKAPEDVSPDAEVSPEIASIVDSVLADLRPKIVEEISRKLGKKK